jgi:hypothetical protein
VPKNFPRPWRGRIEASSQPRLEFFSLISATPPGSNEIKRRRSRGVAGAQPLATLLGTSAGSVLLFQHAQRSQGRLLAHGLKGRHPFRAQPGRRIECTRRPGAAEPQPINPTWYPARNLCPIYKPALCRDSSANKPLIFADRRQQNEDDGNSPTLIEDASEYACEDQWVSVLVAG